MLDEKAGGSETMPSRTDPPADAMMEGSSRSGGDVAGYPGGVAPQEQGSNAGRGNQEAASGTTQQQVT